MDHPAPAGHALEEVRAAPADMVDIPDLIAPPGQGVVTSNTRVDRTGTYQPLDDPSYRSRFTTAPVCTEPAIRTTTSGASGGRTCRARGGRWAVGDSKVRCPGATHSGSSHTSSRRHTRCPRPRRPCAMAHDARRGLVQRPSLAPSQNRPQPEGGRQPAQSRCSPRRFVRATNLAASGSECRTLARSSSAA